MKRPKTKAPARMVKIILVTMAVSFRESTNLGQLRRLLTRERIKAPPAPIAPPSVGVKIPANNPPITRRKRSTMSIHPLRDLILVDQLDLSPAGPRLGLIRQITYTVNIK